MGAYKGKASTIKEAEDKTEGFKKGGKAAGKMSGGGMYEKGGKALGKVKGVMSEANAARKPRKSGGSVMSSAASGTPRGKSSHY